MNTCKTGALEESVVPIDYYRHSISVGDLLYWVTLLGRHRLSSQEAHQISGMQGLFWVQ